MTEEGVWVDLEPLLRLRPLRLESGNSARLTIPTDAEYILGLEDGKPIPMRILEDRSVVIFRRGVPDEVIAAFKSAYKPTFYDAHRNTSNRLGKASFRVAATKLLNAYGPGFYYPETEWIDEDGTLIALEYKRPIDPILPPQVPDETADEIGREALKTRTPITKSEEWQDRLAAPYLEFTRLKIKPYPSGYVTERMIENGKKKTERILRKQQQRKQRIRRLNQRAADPTGWFGPVGWPKKEPSRTP